jgi:hypothetical protein
MKQSVDVARTSFVETKTTADSVRSNANRTKRENIWRRSAWPESRLTALRQNGVACMKRWLLVRPRRLRIAIAENVKREPRRSVGMLLSGKRSRGEESVVKLMQSKLKDAKRKSAQTWTDSDAIKISTTATATNNADLNTTLQVAQPVQ